MPPLCLNVSLSQPSTTVVYDLEYVVDFRTAGARQCSRAVHHSRLPDLETQERIDPASSTFDSILHSHLPGPTKHIFHRIKHMIK